MKEKTDNSFSGHRERLRTEFIQNGAAVLKDRELLEILLTYSIPRMDVAPHARRLLDDFGTLENVLTASPERLIKTEGIGESTAVFLSAIGEAAKRVAVQQYLPDKKKTKIYSAEQAAGFSLALSMGLSEEWLRMICLGPDGFVSEVVAISRGGLSEVAANPRDIFGKAILKNAAGVILVHNHPSGNPLPSNEDILAARSLEKAGNDLRLPIVDQIVAGKGAAYSFSHNRIFEFISKDECRSFTPEEWIKDHAAL